jgi:CheY-like chemotaxis protein
MDINLPGMNDFTALEKLRADKITKDIPVVAVSASAMPVEIEHGIEARFEGYVTKPINVPEVIKGTTSHIG